MEPSSSSPSPSKALRLGLPLALFAAAFLFRLIGIGWGLQNDLHRHSYHPDEPVVFGHSQRIEPAKLDFAPGFYNYGTLYLSLLRVTSDMVAVYGGAPDLKSEDSFWAYVSRCHLAGRVLSALAGAGTALVLFCILRRFTNPFGAFLGGAAIVVAPAHVVHSRFQTVDVFATFLLAVSAMYALRFLRTEGEEDLDARAATKLAALAGLFAGLSAGTKYTGGLVLLTLFAALILSRRRDALRLGGVGLLASALAFVTATPGVLVESSRFVKDFVFEMRHTAQGHGLVFEGTPSGFVVHLSNLFLGLGLLLGGMGLVGLLYAGFRRKPWALALLAFFVPYYVLIGRAEVKFLRYTFPLYVGIAAGFGWLVGRAHERQGWGRAVVGAGILALGGLDPGGLRSAGTMTVWMAGTDPRDEAARYLKEVAAKTPGMRVGLLSDAWFYTPPLFPDSAAPRWYGPDELKKRMAGAQAPQVEPFPVGIATENPPQYVVFSSFEYDDPKRLRGMTGLRPEVQAQVDRIAAFERDLQARYERARVFGIGTNLVPAHDMQYIRPTVAVWKLKTP